MREKPKKAKADSTRKRSICERYKGKENRIVVLGSAAAPALDATGPHSRGVPKEDCAPQVAICSLLSAPLLTQSSVRGPMTSRVLWSRCAPLSTHSIFFVCGLRPFSLSDSLDRFPFPRIYLIPYFRSDWVSVTGAIILHIP